METKELPPPEPQPSKAKERRIMIVLLLTVAAILLLGHGISNVESGRPALEFKFEWLEDRKWNRLQKEIEEKEYQSDSFQRSKTVPGVRILIFEKHKYIVTDNGMTHAESCRCKN